MCILENYKISTCVRVNVCLGSNSTGVSISCLDVVVAVAFVVECYCHHQRCAIALDDALSQAQIPSQTE